MHLAIQLIIWRASEPIHSPTSPGLTVEVAVTTNSL